MEDEGDGSTLDESKQAAASLARQLEAHRAAIRKPISGMAEDEDQMSISSEEGVEAHEGEMDQETALMAQMIGITGFESSKGKDHTESEMSGVSRKTKRQYRQYMNRQGGFNRPLAKVF